jgi:hypothetical protein
VFAYNTEKDLERLLGSIKPDTWNNIPCCLVKSLTALVEAVQNVNNRINYNFKNSTSGLKAHSKQLKVLE